METPTIHPPHSMTPYADRLKAHLAAYKRAHLGVDEDGIHYGTEKPHPYILPPALKRLNVLETFRAEFWSHFEANRARLALHTDFHHLNSSQAFTFNLLFPLATHAPAALLAGLGIEPGDIAPPVFEAIPDPAERTSVDLLLTLADRRRVFIEVKLTETAFGSCADDEAHRRKYHETYAPRLRERLGAEIPDAPLFFQHYQLYRNLCQLDLQSGDLLVLLVPRTNERAWPHAVRFATEQVPAALRPSILAVATEDLLSPLTARPGLPPRLQARLDLLAEKYFPATA